MTEGEGGGYAPFGRYWPNVPHYYGDYVRQLMFGASVLMIFGAPYYSEDVRVVMPIVVIAVIVLIAFAALTNPWKQNIMMYDAVANGVGLMIFQVWALLEYESSTPLAFVLRQALSLIFLTAFYFSIKTLRAMMLDQIGKRDTLDEFRVNQPRPGSNAIISRFLKKKSPKQPSEFLHKKPHGGD